MFYKIMCLAATLEKTSTRRRLDIFTRLFHASGESRLPGLSILASSTPPGEQSPTPIFADIVWCDIGARDALELGLEFIFEDTSGFTIPCPPLRLPQGQIDAFSVWDAPQECISGRSVFTIVPAPAQTRTDHVSSCVAGSLLGWRGSHALEFPFWTDAETLFPFLHKHARSV